MYTCTHKLNEHFSRLISVCGSLPELRQELMTMERINLLDIAEYNLFPALQSIR